MMEHKFLVRWRVLPMLPRCAVALTLVILISVGSHLIAAEPLRIISTDIELDQRKVALGRMLFHDKRLSKDDTVSCGTCHKLEQGGAGSSPGLDWRRRGPRLGQYTDRVQFSGKYSTVLGWPSRRFRVTGRWSRTG